MPQPSPWITEATAANFEAEVVERSMERPVVVDFWASWCGPCRQLTPILEKLANEHAGRFQLVKVNIDHSPEIAGAFGVQSIPHVFAVDRGRPVDQFVGLMSEEQVREWLSRLLPSPVHELIQKGRSLEAQDPSQAELCYREAAQLNPENDEIKIHLARVIVAQNRDEEARRIIDELAARGYLEPEAEKLKSQLELRSAAEEAGDVADLRRQVEEHPGDLALQLKLADALVGARKHEEALQICLDLIAKDKAGVGPEAKDTMVKIFEVLGPGSELTGEYRRKLATAWY